ncbi:uncharacterized protein JN550_010309 [Neoarthrinium moseri]|uniref:uncharacterized protein n=1 Tax=Neoarthrinium moseri TaxID=1658444 RepID=UPI001FDE4C75|nr:uncharacterized protein JN550_010309 [Neoarthrinium moseri]KAI1862302.1 hypothetical protein JN550_010309 [Neoarthrinium moseri]
MANKFDDLALRYVLADDGDKAAAQEAVGEIKQAASTRTAIGQWVASINQWMGSKSDDIGDDDVISRAKALDFLASTLDSLPKDILKADQVKLLIGFFCSLFSSDHRAGIMASSRSLRELTSMKAFQPSSGNDIVVGITKLGTEDFKRQTPATRLEIYELLLSLLTNPLVAEDLAYRHGNTCEFMTALIDLCKNERDPQNLIKWFELQRLFLQNFAPVDDVTEEVFKTFSAYFPITLRASATPSGITVDDLKRAVRSCFSAHHRVARLAIPFLLNKLDQGEAVTISVKVDILQTLEACIASYQHVQQGIVPYSDQIWTSLKYEVRNGEIVDSIEATLRLIGTLARRLEGQDLQAFFAATWVDLGDDLSNSAYSQSAAKLLTAIAGASKASFALASKQAIPHIESTLKHSTSTPHQTELVSLFNALLLVRAALNDVPNANLQDELFGDALFESVYSPLWTNWTQTHFSTDRLGIMSKLIDGMSSLVAQRSSGDHPQRLCSDATCNRIFNWLGTPAVINPLEGKNFLQGSQEKEYSELIELATEALAKVAPIYPSGFHFLLAQFVGSITTLSGAQASSQSQAQAIFHAGARLAYIGTKSVPSAGSPLINSVSVINTLLVALQKTVGVSSLYWTSFVSAIHLAISMTFSALEVQPSVDASGILNSTNVASSQNAFEELRDQIHGLPEIDQGDLGDLEKTNASLNQLGDDKTATYHYFQSYSLYVVSQLYRRFASLSQTASTSESHSPKAPTIILGSEFVKSTEKDTDIFLHQLSQLATTVVRPLSKDIQLRLRLVEEVFLLFTRTPEGQSRKEFLDSVVSSREESYPDRMEPIVQWTVCTSNGFRTAPLALGILQGLWPEAMRELYAHGVLQDLSKTLTTPELAGFSAATRAALDTMLAILANRLPPKESMADYMDTARICADGFTLVARRGISQSPEVSTSLEIFRSILHFVGGDIVNYKSGPANELVLRLICDTAPTELTMGRQLAQCFDIIVSPKECLTKENHAVIKRLHGQWIYQQAVLPYLNKCFPRAATGAEPAIDDRCATNRSVAVFALLKHLDYAAWRNESEQVARVVVRSLTKFGISKDINTVLQVLLTILSNDAELLKQHLTPLVTHTLAVYQMARNVVESLEFVNNPALDKKSRKEAAMCRKSCLEFLKRLPSTYETRYLLAQRQSALRGLATACGDPVREVREVAIVARREWENMS